MSFPEKHVPASEIIQKPARSSIYDNKEVQFHYQGEDLFFTLSHGLFSSFSLDKGSKFLLHCIADNLNMSRIGSILDLGSGVGSIAVSCKKIWNHADVSAIDRDALACEYTRRNSQKNNAPVTILSGLDLLVYDHERELLIEQEKTYDLILSNIPAKAGAPVLSRFFEEIDQHLSPGGTCALVIVQTLADTAIEILDEIDAEDIRSFDEKDHRVIFFDPSTNGSSADAADAADAAEDKTVDAAVDSGSTSSLPEEYIREIATFSPKSSSPSAYTLTTVYNLPGFDTVPLSAQLLARQAAAILKNRADKKSNSPRRLFFWNPGQGHIPSIICAWFMQSLESSAGGDAELPHIILADRDLLALETSSRNLSAWYPRKKIHIIHGYDSINALELLKKRMEIDVSGMPAGDLDGIIIDHSPIPKSDCEGIILKTASYLVSAGNSGAFFSVTGKSSDTAFLSRGISGMRRSFSKKHKGYRLDTFQIKDEIGHRVLN
ncbi:MAG: methyltransferase [Spirochaetales bacterium]|nr:methyltransferase [Spirochaetales bacterium]